VENISIFRGKYTCFGLGGISLYSAEKSLIVLTSNSVGSLVVSACKFVSPELLKGMVRNFEET
jgi:hypothetical protein